MYETEVDSVQCSINTLSRLGSIQFVYLLEMNLKIIDTGKFVRYAFGTYLYSEYGAHFCALVYCKCKY
jgi:hypothetical protein